MPSFSHPAVQKTILGDAPGSGWPEHGCMGEDSDYRVAWVNPVFIVSVALCTLGGGLLGKLTAVRFPRYYPSVFPDAAAQPFFDATDVGIATGIGQGACTGLFVGAAVVLALAVANRRRDG